MEQREILIANTKTQRRSKVITDATTLGELKNALDAAGIDYSGMTFTEGISKTQLLDDATQLPKDIMYKGHPTNNLVILLTNTKKNIASGAKKTTSEVTMSRKEILEYIKVNHLQDEVMRLFGNNATRVSTANLLTLIKDEPIDKEETEVEATNEEDNDDSDYDNDYDEVKKREEEDSNNYTIDSIIAKAELDDIEDIIFFNIATLVKKGALDFVDIKYLKENLDILLKAMSTEKNPSKSTNKNHEKVSSSDGNITEDDIDGMIDDLGI